MADQLLDLTGLQYFKQQCDATYITEDDVPVKSVKLNDFALTPDAQGAVNIHIGMNGGTITPDEYGYVWIPAPTMYWGGDSEPYQWGLLGTNESVRFDNHADGVKVDLEREHSDSPKTVSYSKVLASTDYVSVRTIKVDSVALTPDAQKAVNVKTGRVIVQADNAAQTGVLLAGYTSAGADCNTRFSRAADGVRFQTAIDDSGATTPIDVTLPDEARVSAMIAAAQVGVTWDIVTDLPATGTAGKMYLKGPIGSGTNIYEEWIWINTGTEQAPNWVWENIGTTAIDLSGYVQKTDIELITTQQIDALFATTTP